LIRDLLVPDPAEGSRHGWRTKVVTTKATTETVINSGKADRTSAIVRLMNGGKPTLSWTFAAPGRQEEAAR
jgi:hypothetical protein